MSLSPRPLVFIVLIMFVINNITEASLAKSTLGWFLFLVISARARKIDSCASRVQASPSPKIKSLLLKL